jgi:cytochrome P450
MPTEPDVAPSVDLSDIDGFWGWPIEERAQAFADLRAMPGLPFFAEPEFSFVPRGAGYYALTRLDDILEASRRPDIFRSRQGATGIADLPTEFLEFYGSMINMDRPEHSRLRRIVSRGFTPARMARLHETVRSVTSRLVSQVIDAGSFDAVTDLAAQLPLEIICDMMGVPASQREMVFNRSNLILGAGDPEYVADHGAGEVGTALLTAGGEMAALMRELSAQRHARPTDDLITVLTSAEVDGTALSADELASFFILLAVAGNETTRNAISWGLEILHRYPEQRAAWQADLDGVTPTAVEEIVRWASPVIFMRRTVAEPTELSGQALEPGDKVLLFYWAANRDERYFADAEGVDLRRAPNPHVGFGGTGPHVCLGMHLARLEISTMFRELLTRAPGIHVTGPPDRLRSNFINGIKHLPCEIR